MSENTFQVPWLEGRCTTTQAAVIVGCSKQAIHQKIERGELPSTVKVGEPKPTYLVLESEVRDMAARQRELQDAVLIDAVAV